MKKNKRLSLSAERKDRCCHQARVGRSKEHVVDGTWGFPLFPLLASISSVVLVPK